MKDHTTIRQKYEKIFERAGRPRFYQTPDELRQAVLDYFTECEENMEPPTITGLKMSLNFKSTNSFKDYATFGKEYEEIVESAQNSLREYYEKNLMGKAYPGARFWLAAKDKWVITEKQEITTTTVTKEELEKELTQLKKISE